MPLVTRQSNLAHLFVSDSEPSDWDDNDLWVDSDSSPKQVYVNDSGSASSLISANSDITIAGRTMALYKWIFGA